MTKIVHALWDAYIILGSLYCAWLPPSLDLPGLIYILDPKHMVYSRGSIYSCCIHEQMNEKDNHCRLLSLPTVSPFSHSILKG